VTTARAFPTETGNPAERWMRVAFSFGALALAWWLLVRRASSGAKTLSN